EIGQSPHLEEALLSRRKQHAVVLAKPFVVDVDEARSARRYDSENLAMLLVVGERDLIFVPGHESHVASEIRIVGGNLPIQDSPPAVLAQQAELNVDVALEVFAPALDPGYPPTRRVDGATRDLDLVSSGVSRHRRALQSRRHRGDRLRLVPQVR